MIIGLCGFADSGKGTVGDFLESRYEFKQISFASTLKDTVSIMFGWSRDLLEGQNSESRVWREREDPYWTKKFGYKVTPRNMLQKMGTEVIRNNLHDSFWLYSLEHKIEPKQNYVITDIRFPNEIDFLKSMNGYLVRVRRGIEPDWKNDAIADLRGNRIGPLGSLMTEKWPKVHISEWNWLDSPFECVLANDGTVNDLLSEVVEMMKTFDKH